MICRYSETRAEVSGDRRGVDISGGVMLPPLAPNDNFGPDLGETLAVSQIMRAGWYDPAVKLTLQLVILTCFPFC